MRAYCIAGGLVYSLRYQAASFSLGGNQLLLKWRSLLSELLERLLRNILTLMNSAAVSYILCPRRVVKKWRPGYDRQLVRVGLHVRRRNSAKRKKKRERSRGASIKPSMNQSRRHIIHPQWCGRLCGTELLNSVLIGAREAKWDTCGRQEEKCTGPKKNFCFS